MCKELKLVIEVAGITHHFEETTIKDRKKTRDLEQAGFKVIRLSDEEVLNDMQAVIRRVEHIIDGIKDHPRLLRSHPRPAGDKTAHDSGG